MIVFLQVGQISQIFDAMDFLGLYPNDIPSGKVLYKLQGAFKQLQHFNTSFFGIVLPEGLKSFQSEDPSGKDSLPNMYLFYISAYLIPNLFLQWTVWQWS